MGDVNIVKTNSLSSANANILAVDINNAGGTIKYLSNVTLTIGASGRDFTTVKEAFDYIDSSIVSPSTKINIIVDDGTYTSTVRLSAINPNYQNVYLYGRNTYSKSMTSVQSSSGSSGVWSVIINLNTVTNISVGDFVAIQNPSGGTLPTFIAGCHEVTNVDSGNNRITILSTHRHATPPSGSISATVTVLKAILKFNGCDGLVVYNNITFGTLSNLCVVGNKTANSNGLSNQDGSRLYIDGVVGVSGFDYNVFSLYGSEINGDGTICSSNAINYGFVASQSGIIVLNNYTVASGNGQIGIYANNGGQIDLRSSISTGNAQQGVLASGGGIVSGTPSSVSTGNNRGLEISKGGLIPSGNFTSSSNTNTDSLTTIIENLSCFRAGAQVTVFLSDGTNGCYLTQNGTYTQLIGQSGVLDIDGKTGVRLKLDGITKVTMSSSGNGFNGASAVYPVLPTGAGKTVDEVIAVLQTLGLVRQS